MDNREHELEVLRRALLDCRYQIAILVKMLSQAIYELNNERGRGKPWQPKH